MNHCRYAYIITDNSDKSSLSIANHKYWTSIREI